MSLLLTSIRRHMLCTDARAVKCVCRCHALQTRPWKHFVMSVHDAVCPAWVQGLQT